jgi:hypothetical protein
MGHLLRHQSAGPLLGFPEQVFSNSQTNRGRTRVIVPEEGEKVDEPTVWIDPLAIPSKQCPRSFMEKTTAETPLPRLRD